MTDVMERPDTLTRAAITFKPESLNREAGTVDVTLSTGAAVQRSGFIERLAIGRDNVDVGDRIPVLDAHRQTSIADVLGRVIDVRFEADRIDATLRISNPATLDAIERGDLTGISIGYRVTQWSETAPRAAGPRVRTATKWTLLEASLVPIPADPSAYIRSECTMTTQVAELQNPAVQAAPPAQTETRAAINAQIRSLAETAGLDRTWADAQIDGEADINSARAAAFEAMQRRTAPVSQIRAHVTMDHDAPAVVLERQAEALAQRMGGPVASEAARQFVGFSFVDHARQILQRAGERTDMMSAEAILQRAMMTTSDFPLLMESGGNRVLQSGYQAAESPLKRVAVRREVTDLRDVSVLKVGEGSALEPVTESGEVTHGSFNEGSESYTVETFGKIYTLSRKLVVNDQFNVFGDMMRKLGQLAAAAEGTALVNLLLQGGGAGPVMSDGKRLFHADHGNVATATWPADAWWDFMKLAVEKLRLQTGIDGITPLNIAPKYLVVPPALEGAARDMWASFYDTTVARQGKVPWHDSLELIIEPRLAADKWLVFGDQATAPVLEMAYLASAPGPQIQSRDGWDTLGREFRVTLDLGVGVTDHRGVVQTTVVPKAS